MAGKKRKMVLLFFIIVLCMQIGCQKQTAQIQKNTVSEIKLGVAVYKKEDTFISMLISNLEEEIKKAQQQKNVKITMNTMDAKGSQTVQNDQIDKLIEQGCDILCVNLVDRTVASAVIDKAKAADIPVIFFNREPVSEDLERWDNVYYVGAEASESGYLQGRIVVEAYEKNPYAIDKNGDGKIQYVVLEGEQGHQDALLRTEYAVKTITDAGIQMDKLAGDTANWDRSQAATKMNQWLQMYKNQIELVLSNNDDMAIGAIDAYESAAKPLPAIVGVDGTALAIEALQEGKLLGTVENDPQKQAELIFSLSYDLAIDPRPRENTDMSKQKYFFTKYTIIYPEDILKKSDKQGDLDTNLSYHGKVTESFYLCRASVLLTQ